MLKPGMSMSVSDAASRQLVESWVSQPIPEDKRFVYYLLASRGICVVPISSFASELQGFRVTLLEEDETILTRIFTGIREGIQEYTA